MWTSFKRVLSGGAKNFARSGLVSFATVLIMTVTMFIIGTLLFLSALLTHTLSVIQDKVDVNVYFTTTASESNILAVESKLQSQPEVVSVTYTSRDDALAQFRQKHTNDQLTLQALDELGSNPLGASLAIKAKDPSQYDQVVQFLSNDPSTAPGGTSIIDRINYYQNKDVIDRLSHTITSTREAGLILIILFALASVIITFATIRLAIYSSRDEIAVMRLVGASNMYIRGPFIVAGMIAGVLSALIALALFYPIAWYTGSTMTTWLGGFNLFTYYTSNFALLFSTLVGAGIVLGSIASLVAVRTYLKI